MRTAPVRAAEVLFLVPTEGRLASTEAALAKVASATSRVAFRVCTNEKALADVQGLVPVLPETVRTSGAPLLRPEDHETVNAFVLSSTKALAQANAALRRHGQPEVASPRSTDPMLVLLRRTQRG